MVKIHLRKSSARRHRSWGQMLILSSFWWPSKQEKSKSTIYSQVPLSTITQMSNPSRLRMKLHKWSFSTHRPSFGSLPVAGRAELHLSLDPRCHRVGTSWCSRNVDALIREMLSHLISTLKTSLWRLPWTTLFASGTVSTVLNPKRYNSLKKLQASKKVKASNLWNFHSQTKRTSYWLLSTTEIASSLKPRPRSLWSSIIISSM